MHHTLELKILDARFGADWPLPAYATEASAAWTCAPRSTSR